MPERWPSVSYVVWYGHRVVELAGSLKRGLALQRVGGFTFNISRNKTDVTPVLWCIKDVTKAQENGFSPRCMNTILLYQFLFIGLIGISFQRPRASGLNMNREIQSVVSIASEFEGIPNLA